MSREFYNHNALARAELEELHALQRMAVRSDAERMRLDLLLYGTSYGRRREDGTIEHIPATEVIVNHRTAVGPLPGGMPR